MISATMSVQFALWNDAAFFAASQTRATIHEYEKDGNTFLEFVVQINTGTKPWGVLRLGLSLDPLNREISKTRKELMKESKNRLSTNQQAGFFKNKGDEEIYIRTGPSSIQLKSSKMIEYIETRSKKHFSSVLCLLVSKYYDRGDELTFYYKE